MIMIMIRMVMMMMMMMMMMEYLVLPDRCLSEHMQGLKCNFKVVGTVSSIIIYPFINNHDDRTHHVQ